MREVQKLIGMNIKLARTQRCIKQADLANSLEIDPSYLSRIENGSIPISCDRIYQIIEILGCNLLDIFPNPELVFSKKK